MAGDPDALRHGEWMVFAVMILVLLALGRLEERPREPAAWPARRLDINRARRAELMLLPGIGPVTADRIIALRERKGHIADLDQLSAVRGLGPARLERLAPYLSFTPADK